MKTALLKLLASIMSDAESRKKAVVLVLSIVVGFLGLMCLPVVVLSSMGGLEIETPEVDRNLFTDSAFMATLDDDQQSQIAEFQNQGETIATAMSAVGERNESDRIRYCDNAGLMLGYLNYNPADKTFGNVHEILVYTEQGNIDSMPDVAGIGVFDGSQHGIYVGNSEVIYSSADCGYVTKEPVSNGNWISWCTYDGVDYPQEVLDLIDGTEVDSENDSGENSAEN